MVLIDWYRVGHKVSEIFYAVNWPIMHGRQFALPASSSKLLCNPPPPPATCCCHWCLFWSASLRLPTQGHGRGGGWAPRTGPNWEPGAMETQGRTKQDHPSIVYPRLSCQCRVAGGLEPIPDNIGRKSGCLLDESPGRRRADMWFTPHSNLICFPNRILKLTFPHCRLQVIRSDSSLCDYQSALVVMVPM